MKTPFHIHRFLYIYIAFFLSFSHATAETTPQWIWEDPESQHVKAIAMNPTGDTIGVICYSYESHYTGAVFDWRSPWPLFRINHDEYIADMGISDDGNLIVFSLYNPYGFVMYDRSGTLLWRYECQNFGPPTHFQFDSTGQYLGVKILSHPESYSPGRVMLFDVHAQELLWMDDPSSHIDVNGRMRDFCFSSDANTMAVGFYTGITPGPQYIACYDFTAGLPEEPLWIKEVSESASTQITRMTPDGAYILVLVRSHMYLYNSGPATQGEKEPLWHYYCDGDGNLPHAATLNADATLVGQIAGSYGSETRGSTEIINGTNGSPIWQKDMWFKEPTMDAAVIGNRFAISGWETVLSMEDARTVVWDANTGDIIWETDAFGKVKFNDAGDFLAIGGGHFESGMDPDEFDYFYLFDLDDNAPPQCGFTSPQNGDAVYGNVQITGTAQDSDGSIIAVEFISPLGLQLADPQETSLENWTTELNVEELELDWIDVKARAIDDQYKHSPWEEIELEVIISPTPTQTPVPTATVTQTPTPPSNVLSMELLMPDTVLTPGDILQLDAEIINTREEIPEALVVVLLEIHGSFFCWPHWSYLENDGTGLDWQTMKIRLGQLRLSIISETVWPDQAGEDYGLLFWGALLNPDLSQLLAEIDLVAWSYHP